MHQTFQIHGRSSPRGRVHVINSFMKRVCSSKLLVSVIDRWLGVSRTTTICSAILELFGCGVKYAQTPGNTAVFAGADRVRVTRNSRAGADGDTRDISKREQIDAFYHFVSSVSGEWRRPTFDAPFRRWVVEFRRDGKTLGSYGVGSNFLGMNDYVHVLEPEQLRLVIELLEDTSTPLR